MRAKAPQAQVGILGYPWIVPTSGGCYPQMPIGVRWAEPVVGGTDPVIVHPHALGESQMAERAVKVLNLG